MATDHKSTVCVIGAGPIGIEFALFARKKFPQSVGITIIEKGAAPGNNVLLWAHVKLFSPWSLNVSSLGLEILKEVAPDHFAEIQKHNNDFPTGNEFVEHYIQPLAQYLQQQGVRILTSTKVLGVSRNTMLKGDDISNKSRKGQPFKVLVESSNGNEDILHFDVVIDASGSYGNHKWIGGGGIPAINERSLKNKGAIEYIIPSPQSLREKYANKRTLVIGGGYSAITAIAQLLDLAKEFPQTRVQWLTRHQSNPYTLINNDPLPERDRLGVLGNTISTSGSPYQGVVEYLGNICNVDRIDQNGNTLTLKGEDNGKEVVVPNLDNILALVGYMPDNSLYKELHIHQCWASEGPYKLAGNLFSQQAGADCLSQSSPGPDLLRNPEPDFFILGSKSYGRNSKFLIKVGLEQIDQIGQLVAGDLAQKSSL